MRFYLLTAFALSFGVMYSQNNPSLQNLLGRWEVLQYDEQGVPVHKKEAALPQAIKVYSKVQDQRARTWYGVDPGYADEFSKRRARAFERWMEQDSSMEVKRVAEAISTPYFAVFFADSTLALYNRDERSGVVSFPESRKYVYYPQTMSMDVYPPGIKPSASAYGWVDRWEIQIIALTETRMTLFIPEEAEIVVLEKTVFKLP